MLLSLQDATVFRSNLAQDFPARPWRPSRSCPAVTDGVAVRLFETQSKAQPPYGLCTTFPVLKSNGIEARLIVDPEINDRMNTNPASGMQYVHDIMQLMSTHQYACCLDAKSYFNQFYLSDGVKPFFTVKVRSRRGPARYYQYTRMPMGWSWSVAIAQRSLLAILKAAGLSSCATVWVDNIYIGGCSAADVEAKLQKFDEIAKAVNLTYREECRGSTVTYLGIEADLLAGTFNFSAKWISKVCDLLTLADHTGYPVPLHELQSTIGCLVWACYLTTSSMLDIRHSLLHLAYQTSSAASCKASTLPDQVKQEWHQSATRLKSGGPYPLSQQQAPFLPTSITTDSSSYGGAAVFSCNGSDDMYNWWWQYPQHINYLELACLAVGLQRYPWPDQQQGPATIHWTTDNTVSEKVVKKMYSKSRPLQDILLYIQAILDLHDCTVAPTWISTHLNVTADKGSRDLPASAPVLSPVPPFEVLSGC
jgi:hypothetical protein